VTPLGLARALAADDPVTVRWAVVASGLGMGLLKASGGGFFSTRAGRSGWARRGGGLRAFQSLGGAFV
jgi:hypothetical protein